MELLRVVVFNEEKCKMKEKAGTLILIITSTKISIILKLTEYCLTVVRYY